MIRARLLAALLALAGACREPAFAWEAGGWDSGAGGLAADPGACAANRFVTDLDIAGNLVCTQPAFSDLSGSATDAQVPAALTLTTVTGSGDLTCNADGTNDVIVAIANGGTSTFTVTDGTQELDVWIASGIINISARNDGGTAHDIRIGGEGVAGWRFQDSGVGNGAFTPDSDASMDLGQSNLRPRTTYTAGLAPALATKTGAYTLTASDYTILCDTAGGGFTLTLPAAASHPNRVYVIKQIAASNTCTVDGNASETIDGAATHALSTQYDSITIQSNGSNWFIL